MMEKKTCQLRRLIYDPALEFIMEAHNGLSAKIVQEAGFKGIWASGLSISAALGVRDNNEASWTQVLEVCEFMSDATTIPILLDGDTGFGNFNSFRRLITKLEQRAIAGVCIEDKIFPKTNSFIAGEKQPLVEIEEFCGKISAGKDTQTDADFVVVARVEALIAGWGLDETLKRAKAYADAGADAILIHSKRSDASEIEAFMRQWDQSKPIIIVPTMYYRTPTQQFRDWNVSLVIWANQVLRASVTSMQKTASRICSDQSLCNIEETIVPVKEIFRLQNVIEYQQAEDRYLPQAKTFKGLVLAATRGQNFGTLTDDKPKAMIKAGDAPILAKIVNTFNACGVKDIGVVVGYCKDAVNLPNLRYIDNKEHDRNGILYSLYLARDLFDEATIVSFGDILFEEDILRKLIADEAEVVLAVDSRPLDAVETEKDLVRAAKPYSEQYGAENVCSALEVRAVSKGMAVQDYQGEFIGLFKMSREGALCVRHELEQLAERDPDFIRGKSINDFFNYLIEKRLNVLARYFRGHWKDIDSIEDIAYLIKLFSGGERA
jgi:phosphoenolpyruvate phosphomutase